MQLIKDLLFPYSLHEICELVLTLSLSLYLIVKTILSVKRGK
jgi:hypothetical protein